MAQGSFDFSKLAVLVIDDIDSFCSSLRTMLMSFGVETVDIVMSGEEAIRALNARKYDVVLCDYNLGDGKNGHDVLEEAKTHKLLKSRAIYMIVTGETASEMVHGALEYQPDDYLTKPFTKDVLQTRLLRLLARNHLFTKVHRAKDRQQPAEAIVACDELIATESRYKRFAQKLKSEILLEQDEFQQANTLFQQVLMEKPLPWAMLGLGKSYLFLGQVEKAAKVFKQLLEQNAAYVQAWDWLARCQEELGDVEAAKASLEAAVKISPIHVRRQLQLGDLAVATGDAERAERAYGRAVKIGKHSVFRSPESYMKLADVLIEQLGDAEGLVGRRKESKVLEAMEELRSLYRDNPEVHLRSHMAEVKLHTTKGRASESEKAMFKAYDMCTNEEIAADLPGELKESLIEALESGGRKDMADTIVKAMQLEESGRNTLAIEYYDKGDLKTALSVLQEASKEKPRSYAICLNLAQVSIHYMIKHGITDELMAQAGKALERVKSLPEADKRYKTYQGLTSRYQKLQQRQTQHA